MKKIVVVGSTNIDFVVRLTEMPKKGETVHTKSFDKIPGGKGANQACAVGKLGGNCTFLSAVGNDGVSELALNSLRAANVNIRPILISDDTSTGIAIIAVNDEGENSIMIIPGANSLCDNDYFTAHQSELNDADYVIAQLETPIDDVYNLLVAAKEAKKVTILNPAPASDTIPDLVLSHIDFLTPNETELAKVAGMPTETIPEITAAAEALLQRGVGNVLVTVGSRGALLCNRNGSHLYPAYPQKAVDTTAAGDTFNAAFAVALAEGWTMDEAIVFANAAAGLSVTRKGAQTSIPCRSEVLDFMRDHAL